MFSFLSSTSFFSPFSLQPSAFSLSSLLWIIYLAPLLAAAIILLITRSNKPAAAGLAIGAAAITCAGSWILFLQKTNLILPGFSWINTGDTLNISIGMMVDPLSRTMLVVVTTIATLVFIYSIGYMRHEEGFARFFAGLAFFLFSMLGIVLANNFIMMFISWELVGFSSYLLIMHYFEKPAAADAGNQAFMVNRIGDFGFLLGILLLWLSVGSLSFDAITTSLPAFANNSTLLAISLILIFCGTIGKSAQLPLHVWLPNSMEGPTPVSSLLHAATMVAAGVYMLARIFPLLHGSPTASSVVMWIGASTALAAALMGTQQNDFKRVLAYSTISQLGYMVTAVGVAPSAGVPMFHLFTHAFFKCLLFLTAGSVMISMHHELDIWKMGGLRKRMPVTFATFLCGMLALAGCPFFSGSFSKDLIMKFAFEQHPAVFWMLVVAAGLTAFYITRVCVVAFFGTPRTEHARTALESPLVMTLPLLLLAIPAVVAGYPFLEKIFIAPLGSMALPHEVPEYLEWIFIGFFFLGTVGSFLLYRNAAKDPMVIPFLANRLYIDNVYDWCVKNIQGAFAKGCAFFDRWIIDGLCVQGSASLVWTLGFILRFLQVGSLQAYAVFLGAGTIGMILLLLKIH
ncbi:MAG: NADH-quinone oxidoreductase subunit L [Verrucomicrobia bacterium]|nr:NADH-quinone oxidoreductase subunit L [Verrucomicrobiota bacterium]